MTERSVNPATELSSLLSRELTAATELLQLLVQERQALTGKEPEEIESIAGRKQRLMERLGDHLRQRDRFLNAQGYAAGKPGTDELIRDIGSGENGTALAVWQQLQRMAGELRDSNDVNGTMVSMATRQAHQALELLTGRTIHQKTYGPCGQQVSGGMTQALAKA